MNRVPRLVLAAGLATTFVGVLACCVNFTSNASFFVTTYGGKTTLDLYISRVGFYTDVHGGPPSDRYVLVFPAGRDRVEAGQIGDYIAHDQTRQRQVPSSGDMLVKLNDSGCEFVIDLFDAGGAPLPFNGIYRTMRCGQNRRVPGAPSPSFSPPT